VIIDLGEMTAAKLADIDPPALDVAPRPPRNRRRRRLIAVALATVLLVSASSLPIDHDLPSVRLPIGVNARLMIAGTTAIISDRRADANEVAAYDLASGRQIWRSPLVGTALNAQMFVASSTVVVETAHDVGYDQIEGFSLATGARRWLLPALMVTPIPIGLLVYQRSDGNQIDATLIDPTTGDARWRTAIAGNCDVNLATDPAQTMASGLIEVCQDSREVVAVDLATGAIRARAHPDVFPPTGARRAVSVTATNNDDLAHGAPRLSIAYLGDVAILATPHRYPSRSLSAYRTSDLTPLWSGVQITSSDMLTACGPDVCLAGGGSTQLALDPATGQTVAAPPAAEADVGDVRPITGATTTLVVLAGGGRAVPASGIASIDFRAPDADGVSRAVRPPTGGNLWIAVAGDGKIRPLQFVPGVADSSCTAATSYVACTTAVDALTVWAIRTG
jgi:hypothetical protein